MGKEQNRGGKEKRKPKKEKPKAVTPTQHQHEGGTTANQINKHMQDVAKKTES
jgi:hypothetical protein